MAGGIQTSIYPLLRKLEAIFLLKLSIALMAKDYIATKDILSLHAQRNRIVLAEFEVQMGLASNSLTAGQNQILIDFLDKWLEYKFHLFPPYVFLLSLNSLNQPGRIARLSSVKAYNSFIG